MSDQDLRDARQRFYEWAIAPATIGAEGIRVLLEAGKKLDKARVSCGNEYTALLTKGTYIALGGTEEDWDSVESED